MRYLFVLPLVLTVLPTSCAQPIDASHPDTAEDLASVVSLKLGAKFTNSGNITFKVYSRRATRLELDLFRQAFGADEVAALEMSRGSDGVWSRTVTKEELNQLGFSSSTVFYGYRAWGPNWRYDSSWTKGSTIGFVTDVDSEGNRFNPNKLLFDPYGLEMSHDPVNAQQESASIYGTGSAHRKKDTGRAAPKAIVLKQDNRSVGTRPSRPLKDEIIYEVHVRGLTQGDPSVPASIRGTYAGAAKKAAYLRSLGVTAVELLPIHETQNDQNDLEESSDGDNYWGYMTLGYFAPDRRFSSDRSPGGPTREFKDMIAAFHAEGLKVYLDVVYNHTGEGGPWDGTGDVVSLYSFRGLDNPTYYELTGNNRFYFDNTGVGGNFNAANSVVRNLVIDSLSYWRSLGVDGFRFDLAVILGNSCTQDCFNFDKFDSQNILNRAVRELPVRPEKGGRGVDLIAEPWGLGAGTYQVGNFPSGWAEWNGIYRDTLRSAQNKLGVDRVTPGSIAARVGGSQDLFGDDARRPWHSINFMVTHDGFTQRDLYSFNQKQNNQSWPYGPSSGGTDDERSWDYGGDRIQQRQAARTGLALLMLSAGVPMITGGDEMYRTQYGNNNPYNLDSVKNWLDYSNAASFPDFFQFSKRLIAFRRAHKALRPATFFTGRDSDGNGLKDITWYKDDGQEADAAYMDSPSNHFLAWRIDGEEGDDTVRSIYVAYNGWSEKVTAQLPAPANGKKWYRVSDTAAWDESNSNFRNKGDEDRLDGATYSVDARSLLILIER